MWQEPGFWLAVTVFPAREGGRVVPIAFLALSPCDCRMDQEFSRRLSMSEVKDDSGAAKTLSAAARRSFFRRKHKHKRSGSKDGKDLLALDTFSNDSIPLFEGKCWAHFPVGSPGKVTGLSAGV